ncbi:Trm10p [Sugiyamaella lignohabitans]|uniref:tRNA (guanine(9)-N1)-methyltransferase n=1 Tax=Sugiyamaella lignohabitans TaxID=796027 RepID=A0A167DIB9_9ASCO|nr:Trm10p [Sugiyamaella lignohabitans]ANB12949.1 Trm10p [Sugiyamaella lignohabitans]
MSEPRLSDNEQKEIVVAAEIEKESERSPETDRTELDPRHKYEPIPPPPEGMTKSAWKREYRRRKNEAMRDEWVQKRKEKRKQVKQERKRQRQEDAEAGVVTKKPRRPQNPNRLPITVILDCAFDDLMTDKERKSLAIQVSRCYAMNRQAVNSVNLEVSSLNKGLRERFYGPMHSQHLLWKGIKFREDDYEVPSDEAERTKWLYFSSDSTNTLETLDENMTYIIGGIVDKGRYKNLCNDKAQKQNIATAKLPIDSYIKLSGRRVLTTNHVFEILLKWLELKDWKAAFEAVLPQRKLQGNNPEEDDENEDDEADEDKEENDLNEDNVPTNEKDDSKVEQLATTGLADEATTDVST